MRYRALVTAELDVDVLKKTVPEIDFDTAGYCVDHEVMESSELAQKIIPYDILISEFETMEDLEKYKNNPEHVKVSALCKQIRIDRQGIDYEF